MLLVFGTMEKPKLIFKFIRLALLVVAQTKQECTHQTTKSFFVVVFVVTGSRLPTQKNQPRGIFLLLPFARTRTRNSYGNITLASAKKKETAFENNQRKDQEREFYFFVRR